MKALFSILILSLFSIPVLAQGLQDGGQGSGGDEKAEYSIAVNAQWNIVSVPIGVSDYRKVNLFPTATSAAYAFQNGYVIKDTLDNGAGYWLKFPTPQSVSLSGSLITTDSLLVAAGWNMVGSISDPVLASSVVPVGTTIQSSFYYFGNGYSVATTIEPGKGYWVKTSSSGRLVLSSGSLLARPSGQDSLAQTLASLNSITITDASGGQQRLFFDAGTQRVQGFFELPPLPPAGAFDARFASQKMVALESENIMLTSATFPVDLRWSITSPGDHALIVDGKETSLIDGGSLHISNPSSRISLRMGSPTELPKEFSLSQNFPNPFNPSTTIKYDLPKDSRVNLKLFNILGQEVATLVNEEQKAGYRSVQWNATNVASGIYFYRLDAGNFTSVKKLVLLK